jgi:hypothetical protein
MSDANINAKLTQYERPEHIFPTLTATQIARVSTHGKKRAVQAGEVLVEPGDSNFPFFLVTNPTRFYYAFPREHWRSLLEACFQSETSSRRLNCSVRSPAEAAAHSSPASRCRAAAPHR